MLYGLTVLLRYACLDTFGFRSTSGIALLDWLPFGLGLLVVAGQVLSVLRVLLRTRSNNVSEI